MKALKTVALTVAGVCVAVNAGLAAEAYDITIPAVPEKKIAIPDVPPVKIHYAEQNSSEDAAAHSEAASYSSESLDRSIGFSKRTPPDWGKKETVKLSKEAQAGDVNGGKVALYLRGPLMEPDAAARALKEEGFSVLARFPVDKEQQRIVIVFTDDSMQKTAEKPGRGFTASLRMLVDKKDGNISIQNPLYVFKAFLQDDYDETAAKRTLEKLRSRFAGVKNSEDSAKYAVLPKYRFMDAMPYYQDMLEVGSGTTADLLAKARASGKVVFEQKLGNGAVLLGMKLNHKRSKFVDKIGYQNAALLPYPLLIEAGKAKILDPKYYIAVMYPQLSISNFMGISNTPRSIEKECRKIFR
jgi:hypothetical protein